MSDAPTPQVFLIYTNRRGSESVQRWAYPWVPRIGESVQVAGRRVLRVVDVVYRQDSTVRVQLKEVGTDGPADEEGTGRRR